MRFMSGALRLLLALMAISILGVAAGTSSAAHSAPAAAQLGQMTIYDSGYMRAGTAVSSYLGRWNIIDSSYYRVGFTRPSYAGRWNVYDDSYSMVGFVRSSYSGKYNIYASDYTLVGFVRSTYGGWRVYDSSYGIAGKTTAGPGWVAAAAAALLL
jgi:hypothetical protein